MSGPLIATRRGMGHSALIEKWSRHIGLLTNLLKGLSRKDCISIISVGTRVVSIPNIWRLLLLPRITGDTVSPEHIASKAMNLLRQTLIPLVDAELVVDAILIDLKCGARLIGIKETERGEHGAQESGVCERWLNLRVSLKV